VAFCATLKITTLSRIRKLCFLCLALIATRAMAETNSANRFGFTGPEIFPIDPMLGALRVADLDGDGYGDIVLANNSRSKLTILWNQTGKTNITSSNKVGFKREINELPPDARFRIDSIASEKRISSLVVEDLNGDGRPDIAYYGEPKELIVIYNEGTNGWASPKRWPIDDGQLSPNALCAGDLDGDRRTDLVLLAENKLYFLPQDKDGSLGEPRKIPFSGNIRSVQVVDVDGDGRQDLLLVNWDDRNPFRFRLQKLDGQLGPEIYFPFSPIRSYWADSLEQNKKTQMVTIALNSGRAQVSEFTLKPAEPITSNFSQGQFSVLPLNRTEKAKRGLVWADVNGDGLPDLLVAEPENGQVAIHFQQKDGSLASPQAFPSLAGISDIAVSDWDGDGKPEIFLLSTDEKQVGIAQLDEKQRLPFPTLLPLDGRPLVLAVGTLQEGAKPTLAVIVDLDGKRSFITRMADGKPRSQTLSENFKSNPTTLAFHDVDQDGLMDLVVLIPTRKSKSSDRCVTGILRSWMLRHLVAQLNNHG